MPGTRCFLPLSNYSLLSNSAVNSQSIRTSLFRATVGVLMVSCSASAVNAANCGNASLGGGAAGPPSISATESSTTQVLEEIRRRTQLAQQQAQPIPASYTTTADAPPAASSASAEAKAAQQAASSGGTAAKKPVYTKTASAQPAGKDGYVYSEYAGTDRIVGSWGQGFLDYEHHSNIAPGQQENRSRDSRTAGVMSGTDWTWVNAGARQAVQAGFFSGYSATHNTFSDTTFKSDIGTIHEFDTFDRTNNKQQISGSFLGAYLAAIRGNATFDLAFKADIFDLKQSSLLEQTDSTCPTGPGIIRPTAIESGSASVNNYTIAADASYRYDVSPSTWYEPIFSIRYTITDYGNDPTHLTNIGTNPIENTFGPPGRLGLEDGTVLRLQAGIRRGEQGVLPDGGLWTVVGGAFIYSDVAITGFRYNQATNETAGAIFGTSVFPVDEGKVRGLGQILTTFDYANGWSYLLMGEVRGGEDLIGVGGRAGARYRW